MQSHVKLKCPLKLIEYTFPICDLQLMARDSQIMVLMTITTNRVCNTLNSSNQVLYTGI